MLRYKFLVSAKWTLLTISKNSPARVLELNLSMAQFCNRFISFSGQGRLFKVFNRYAGAPLVDRSTSHWSSSRMYLPPG